MPCGECCFSERDFGARNNQCTFCYSFCSLLALGRPARRVATEAQLWGVALLVARLLGEQAVSETAAAMAQQCLAPGAPLRTLCLLLASGAEGALGLPPGGGGAGRSPPTSVGGSAGPLQPGPAGPGAAAAGAGPLDLLAGDWRQQLAVLAANRTPGDERVMERLGERLLREAGQVGSRAGRRLRRFNCVVVAQ